MPHPPTISVVIPCFNDGVFLKDALGSLFNQTLPPAEVLVVNDGSTQQSTLQILQSLNYPGIRIVHQENHGLASARNTGIRNAVGDYIYFLDADDLISPQCLQILQALLEEQEGTIAAVPKIQLFGGSKHGTVWGHACNPYVIRIRNQWGAGIMLLKAAIQEYDLWYDESMRAGYEDWELNIRLARTGKKILFYPDALYHYRIRKRSLLSISRKRHVAVVGYIQAKHSDLYTYDSLLRTKRTHAAGLLVANDGDETADLEAWLASQTFCDWSLEEKTTTASDSCYRLFYSSIDALRRLPPEALECTLMALECYGRARNCLIAVREGCASLFANSAEAPGPNGHRHPLALVTREGLTRVVPAPEKVMSDCDLLIEFVDQNPLSQEY